MSENFFGNLMSYCLSESLIIQLDNPIFLNLELILIILIQLKLNHVICMIRKIMLSMKYLARMNDPAW